MADITLCTNKLCPLRKECKRTLSTSSNWQSHAQFLPYVDDKQIVVCDYQLPVAVTVKTTNGAIE